MAASLQGRSVVLAQRGMVATDHPLASAAGLHVLEQGGNATDAAVCVSAVLGVVCPMMNGVGGDTFVTYFDAAAGAVTTLLGSGAAGLVGFARSVGDAAAGDAFPIGARRRGRDGDRACAVG